jgi:hypothetical protein
VLFTEDVKAAGSKEVDDAKLLLLLAALLASVKSVNIVLFVQKPVDYF